MATGATETGRGKLPTVDNDDTISAAVTTQLSLVSSCERWLARRVEVDGDRNGIVSRIQKRLDNYKQWLIRHRTTAGDISEDDEPWAMDARLGSDDGSVITVTGPSSDGPIKIVAKDDEDKEDLMSVCRSSPMLHEYTDG
jgi:hypothetical protein